MVLITSPELKVAYEQSQTCFRSVFSDLDGKGFSLLFKQHVVKVRLGRERLHVRIPRKMLKGLGAMTALADGVHFRYTVSPDPLMFYDLQLYGSKYGLSFEKGLTDDLIRFLHVLNDCRCRLVWILE